MIADLKPYPVYKPSGVEWLGDVPAHWEMRKLRHTLRAVTERNHPDLPLLSVVREKGVVLRDISSKDENHNFIPDDLTNYKVVRRGHFAMNKMKAWQGSYGVSKFDGVVSPAYFVFSINGVDGDYFHTAIRSKTYVPYFTRASDGVRIGQWDLSLARMREVPFSIPPLPEQAAIVRYLDHVDRRIRRYIRAKQKLVTLLEEQKQALIHQAVTGQIDVRTSRPYPAYKPSGVEWLGDVPAHWGVRKLRSLFGQHGSGTTPVEDHYFGGDVPWIMSGDLNDRVVAVTKRTVTSKALHEVRALKMYPANSLVIAMYGGGATIGKTGILSTEACTNQACYVLADPLKDTNVVYFQAVMNIARPHLVQQSHGGVQLNINAEIVRALRVPVPPLPEQAAIACYLDKATADIDAAIDRDRRLIELLSEYRTRLIADVVTGKLDVREAAASLPEEADEQGPPDEGAPLADDGVNNLSDAAAPAEEPTTGSEATV